VTSRRGSGRPRRLAALPVLAAALVVGAPVLLAADPVAGTDAALEGRVRVSAIIVAFALSADSANVGQSIRAEARITNIGTATLRGIAIDIRADRVGLAIKSPTAEVLSLKPGRSTTVTWSICGRNEGSYVLLVRATHAGVSIESAARLLSITAGGRKACS
jgi:hypothetical protein